MQEQLAILLSCYASRRSRIPRVVISLKNKSTHASFSPLASIFEDPFIRPSDISSSIITV